MSKKPIAKDQHYVPKMYLKRFANVMPKKKQSKDPIYKCYALFETGEIEYVNTKTICFQKYIYELPYWKLSPKVNELEHQLCNIEKRHDILLNSLINRLDAGENFATIMQDINMRHDLICFCALLMHRHPYAIENTAFALRECGVNTNGHPDKMYSIDLLQNHLDLMTNTYEQNFNLVLHRNSTPIPFITSHFPTIFFPPASSSWHIHYIPISPQYMIMLVPKSFLPHDIELHSTKQFVNDINAQHVCFRHPLLISKTKDPLRHIQEQYYPLKSLNDAANQQDEKK